jgi:hypothetical protein
MIFACCDDNRKAAVLGNPAGINGIDYLEVLDLEAISIPSLRQRTLLVYCLRPVPVALTPANVLITGGESITGIAAEWIAPASAPPPQATAAETAFFVSLPNAADILVVRTSAWGDFSTYTLRLVNDAALAREDAFTVAEVLTGFDPLLSEVTFSFKVQCGPEFDCMQAPGNCPSDTISPPPINYLAKDYNSFRQVMLDRINQLLPSWRVSGEADLGMMLAEVISYAGDQLSYRQDAVTTEAYINTARSHISLRRHARLVDYHAHEGCNARAWIHLEVTQPTFIDRTLTRFYTTAPGMPSSLEVTAGNEQAALTAGVVAFEPMQDANLFPEHNDMSFYTWGDTSCCLAKGATEATLKGTLSHLQVGDVLVLKEVIGPETGNPADAEIRHRCAVRLTAVTIVDAFGKPLIDPLFDIYEKAITSGAQEPQPVTEIQWAKEDALPFPVCVSSHIVEDGLDRILTDVSVALGNTVLADQGLTSRAVNIGTVPEPTLFYANGGTVEHCRLAVKQPLPVRFRPIVPQGPLTQAVSLPLTGSPVTPTPVALVTSGWAKLNDGNGLTSLMLAAHTPVSWPQYFGVLATINSGNPAQFDLAVVFNPPGGAPGVSANVVLERFTGLSLTPGEPNYAATQLANSRFIRVPSGFTPAVPVPSGLPSAPTMLTDSGTVDLQDSSAAVYLTINPTPPLGWPPLFSVIAQGQLSGPDLFNLLLIYAPPSAQDVALPVLVEQFPSLSLANVTATVNAESLLVRAMSFEEAPSPTLSATELTSFDPAAAVPSINLTASINGTALPGSWAATADLLSAGPEDAMFVVEIDTDGTALLRFGDGSNGKRPDTGTTFVATYRIGNGMAGNVGADSLIHCAAGPSADANIRFCTNPMPATGGVDPETNAQIRRRAPQAYRTQERAITMRDYVDVMKQNRQVRDAAATLRWTGSWYTVFISAEPNNNEPLGKALKRSLERSANEFRLAGQDVLIEAPQYVPLTIALAVCVSSDYFQADVSKALMQVLGGGWLPNGTAALFNSCNFNLGQPVYLSPIYLAARQIAGVQSVTATAFEPQGTNTDVYLKQGYIPMGQFQVARLDNDPSLPGNGRLQISMAGGK